MIGSRRGGFGVATIAALLAVVTAGSLATIAAADESAEDNATSASDPRAVLLLVGAVHAQRVRSYTGTEYVCAWAQGSASTSVVDVEHVVGSGTVVRVQPSVTAPGGELQEPEQTAPPAPVDPLAVSAVEGGPLDLLRRNYTLTMGSSDASTVQVQARRRDGSMAAAFWIDTHTGLPMRREIFDTSGRLVRASAFVEMHLANNVLSTVTTTAAPLAKNAETVLDRTQVAALRNAGWVLPAQLPGGMVLYDARQQGSGPKTIVHLSYSDGLSTLSVFVQRGRLATHGLGGWQKSSMGGAVYVRDTGLARRVTWNGRGRVYTLVADAPPTSVSAVVSALPHGVHHRGFVGRLRHGLARLGSWLNPFS